VIFGGIKISRAPATFDDGPPWIIVLKLVNHGKRIGAHQPSDAEINSAMRRRAASVICVSVWRA